MKPKLFSRSIAFFLTFIFIFGLFPSMTFAQPVSPLTGEVKGFNSSVFNSHFSKADRELTPERWLSEAKLGLTQAIYAWELVACGLYENTLLFDDAKMTMKKWSNEELEKRFSQWLTGRFFGEVIEKALKEYSFLFGEIQKKYSWHLDDDGNIVFDDKTGDPLVIRPDDDRNFSDDLLLWRIESENHEKAKLNSFNSIITGLYTELLAYIPEELRETMREVIIESGANIAGSIKREFENIAAREERIFTSRRTRDIWSLRKKSDDEAARIFTQKLISETEETCSRGIEALTIRIEEASAGTGDLALLGEEWLRLYKEQFDRGLKAWEEAEERFFMRRIEWEQESFRLFSEGEQMWINAFSQFEEERRKWELKAKDLFQSGETMFKNISENFERSIAEAKQEFELNMTMRIGEGTAKVKALIDMYLICSSAAISAMENVKFWHSQHSSPGKKDPKDPEFYSWLLQEQARTNGSLISEIIKSYDIYISYMEKAMETRERILSNYSELFGTGALKDVLSPNVSSEDFSLDEYQTALIKAKALVLYWERKTAIAEAVISYANEFSAGRITEAEGLRAWEDAKAAYNASLAAYETELNKLTAIGEDIQKQQEVLLYLSRDLQREEEKLNNLNSEYSLLVSASIINRSDFYLVDLNAKYEYLAKEYKLFLESGGSSVYKNILDYGNRRDIAEYKEAAEGILAVLIHGDGAQIASLAELEENGSSVSLKIRLAGIDLFADNSNGQLRPYNSIYSGADWYSKAKGLNLTEAEKAELYGEKLFAQLADDYQNSIQKLLEERFKLEINSFNFLLQIDLLPDSSEYILPEFCLINEDIAVYIHEILLKLKERIASGENIYTGNSEENEVIDYFLSGGSFFSDADLYLSVYYDEYLYNLNLLELYREFSSVSSFARNELLNEICISLAALCASYGLEQTRGSLPDAKNIFTAISQKPGDLMQNTAQFLLDFDKCFRLIPDWLEYEINIWKNAFLEYAAANLFNSGVQYSNMTEILSQKKTEADRKYNELFEYANSLSSIDENEANEINNTFSELSNELIKLYYIEQIYQSWKTIKETAGNAENEKHWRQFLTEEYLTDNDPAIMAANSWKEGILEDALFNASYHSNRINDAFKIFLQKDFNYTDDNSSHLYNLYSEEASKIYNRFNIINFIYNEISNSGKSYDFSNKIPEDMKTQLQQSYETLKAQEITYNAIRNEYLSEADKFLNIGNLYDNQYSTLKKAHNNTDEKRFEYEKQDAIQRWASTSYLNTDHIDLVNCKNSLAKAQTVLTVLSDIYSNENRRPYDNPEYSRIYAEYEQSFARKIKILETVEILTTSIMQEYSNNEKIFSEYQKALHQLGYVDQNYSDYISPESRENWNIKDVIMLKDGRLVFSRDASMNLSGIDEKKAEELNNFFNTTLHHGNEQHEISLFDDVLRGLSQRMTGYFSNSEKFRQWSLARDYLLLSLIQNNSDLAFLNDYYSGIGQMKRSGSLGSLMVKDRVFQRLESLYSGANINSYNSKAVSALHTYWDDLSETEKADLEFYVILTLLGTGNEYFTGFSQVYTLDVYQHGYDFTHKNYTYAQEQLNTRWKAAWSWIYRGMRDYNNAALNRIRPALSHTKGNVNKWINGLKRNLTSIQDYASAYIQSCEKIKLLEGEKNSLYIEWEDINLALLKTEKMSETEIEEIKNYWEKMQADAVSQFSSIPDALTGLLYWARNTEEKNNAALDVHWQNDSQNQQKNAIYFQMAAEAFFAGNINTETLKIFAENAYGKNAAAWKNHHQNVLNVLTDNLSMYTNSKFNFFSEFNIIGEEITAITGGILRNKYTAEFMVREYEWKLQMQDISEKYNEWMKSASLILENGRTDWNISIQKMEEAYKQWSFNFQSEYSRVSDEWAIAYLAGLEDKEKWLEQAALAANEASVESFLMLVGTEGERLSRFMDTREPFGIRNAVPETDTLIAELLMSSGIANMYSAFGAINNIAGAASTVVRRGLAGLTWDSALAKTAAADMARKANTEIAERETRKLAYYARLAADEAIKSLTDNISMANISFRNNMDNFFIMEGLWRKSGNGYAKDIIKGSTLFTPVISEIAHISGYRDYKLGPLSLQTNIDENYLASLDTIAIRGLIENVYIEIGAITAEIFGIGEDVKIINTSYREKREQSPGKFGAHIGYEPATKPPGKMGSDKESIFYDEGAGELGRLITQYTYWAVIDSIGMAEVVMAPWDKRIWNDEGSWFKSPSIRSVGSIACSIAAGFVTAGAGFAGIGLSVGINSASEIFFSALDLTFGYKGFDDVIFSVGKTLITNTISSAGAGLFNGIYKGDSLIFEGLTSRVMSYSDNPIYRIAAQTMMTGAQTASISLATSAINGVPLGADGYRNFASSVLTSMTSTFTASSLGVINSGVSMEKLEGFSRLNKTNLSKLNNLAGSLAGQGVNYAMGNDFILNVLNMSLFGKEGGLLELHLGRDGASMNIGTGGANVSFDNLAAAFKGALVWNTNSMIGRYTKDNEFKAANSLRALYGFGDTQQKNLLWDILKERVEIITSPDGNLTAKTVTNDGNRAVYLTGYQQGMSAEEQMRLAAILGHEAYRDGYITGEMNAYGNIITAEMSYNELIDASIARILMGDRINEDYNWFYELNADFASDSFFLNIANALGNNSLIYDYLEIIYDNKEDNFFQRVITKGNFQNDDEYRDIPLFNSQTLEMVNEINKNRLLISYGRYQADLPREQRENPMSLEEFKKNEQLLNDFGYKQINFESIYMVGCMFMSIKYGLEAIMGKQVDTMELHNFIKDNNHLIGNNDLSNELVAKIMTHFSNGDFTVSLIETGLPNLSTLYKFDQSDEMYIAHLRIKNNGTGAGYHSVMLSEIEYTNNNDIVTEIKKIHVANPWNDENFTGKLNYTLAQIARWDIFKVTYNTSQNMD